MDQNSTCLIILRKFWRTYNLFRKSSVSRKSRSTYHQRGSTQHLTSMTHLTSTLPRKLRLKKKTELHRRQKLKTYLTWKQQKLILKREFWLKKKTDLHIRQNLWQSLLGNSRNFSYKGDSHVVARPSRLIIIYSGGRDLGGIDNVCFDRSISFRCRSFS